MGQLGVRSVGGSERAVILEKYNMSLGNGLGPLKDRVFRIRHLGDLSDLSLLGTLGSVQAAIDRLMGN